MKWVKRLVVENAAAKISVSLSLSLSLSLSQSKRKREIEVDQILYMAICGPQREGLCLCSAFEKLGKGAYFKWMIRNKAFPLGRQLGKQMASFVWNTKYAFFQVHTAQCCAGWGSSTRAVFWRGFFFFLFKSDYKLQSCSEWKSS